MPVVRLRGIPVRLRSLKASDRARKAGPGLPWMNVVGLAWIPAAAAADIAGTDESDE